MVFGAGTVFWPAPVAGEGGFFLSEVFEASFYSDAAVSFFVSTRAGASFGFGDGAGCVFFGSFVFFSSAFFS